MLFSLGDEINWVVSVMLYYLLSKVNGIDFAYSFPFQGVGFRFFGTTQEAVIMYLLAGSYICISYKVLFHFQE